MPGLTIKLISDESCRPPSTRGNESGFAITKAKPPLPVGLLVVILMMTTVVVLISLPAWNKASALASARHQVFAKAQAVVVTGPNALGCVLKAETLWRYEDDVTPDAEAARRFMEINPRTCRFLEGRLYVVQQAGDDHVTEVSRSSDALTGFWTPTDLLRPAPASP